MTDTKRAPARPEQLSDADLDQVSGGQNYGETLNGPLKANIASIRFDADGNVASKTLFAQAAGGGNVAGGGGSGGSYTFDEIIDGEYVPVTYRVG